MTISLELLARVRGQETASQTQATVKIGAHARDEPCLHDEQHHPRREHQAMNVEQRRKCRRAVKTLEVVASREAGKDGKYHQQRDAGEEGTLRRPSRRDRPFRCPRPLDCCRHGDE